MLRRLKTLFDGVGRLFGERRRQIRAHCQIPVQIQTPDGTLEGTAIELSPGGVRVRLGRELKVGLAVRLNWLGSPEEPVNCTVTWNREQQTGLTFCDPPEKLADCWVYRLLNDLGIPVHQNRERRQHIRAKGPIEAWLVTAEGEPLRPVTVADLSSGGALLETDPEMTLPEQFHLRLGPEAGLDTVTVRATLFSSIALEEHHSHRVRFDGNRTEDIVAVEYYVALLATRG